jgi:hypothetical protein
LDHFGNQIRKPFSITGRKEDGLAMIAPKNDVVEAAIDMKARGTGHLRRSRQGLAHTIHRPLS